MANSPPLVTRLLDTGADATRAPGMEETHWFSSTAEGSGFEAIMGQVTLVHFAVLNGYLVVGKHPADTARHEDALTILSTLIERGADVHARATFASAVCFEHNEPSTAPSTAEPALQTDIDGLSPCSFARLLAVQLEMQTVHSPVHRQAGDSQVAWLDTAIARLDAAERAAAEGHTKSAPGSPSVHAFLAAFSTQCDVRFVCSADGTTLHAHQAVLAAASDHFRSLFSEARAASSGASPRALFSEARAASSVSSASSGASPRSPEASSHVVARVEITSSKWEKAAVRVQAWIRGHQAS
jgi:BTB/POZ domain